MKKVKLVIVGGGPAGLSAAISAREAGIDDILLIERDHHLGGILNQCIHNGFGLHTFREELSGPEYALKYIHQLYDAKIPYVLETMVVSISSDKVVTLLNHKEGMHQIQAESIILAMGCRERPRGALSIPGYRPAGIYSAGTAQYFVNVEGFLPGREVVILGSGDIGLIMARRMTLEGAKVHAVAEIMPYSSGLNRNKVQCLDDFNIPLLLNTTVVEIKGKTRVTSVVLAKVDEHRRVIPETRQEIKCDTLLLSCGLIPENELSNGMGLLMNSITGGPIVNESLETSMTGVFTCGNVLHVHDLADNVSMEAAQAGREAALYLKGTMPVYQENIKIKTGNGVRYTVPMSIDTRRMQESLLLRFRVDNIYQNKTVTVTANGQKCLTKKRQNLAPGEMEQITITKKQLEDWGDHTITISLED